MRLVEEFVESRLSKWKPFSGGRPLWAALDGSSRHLISLMELLRFGADGYLRILRFISQLEAIAKATKNEPLGDKLASNIARTLRSFKKFCKAFDLEVSAETLEKVARNLKGQTITTHHDWENLIDILETELNSSVFLAVPRDRRELFENPLSDWEAVLVKFPDAQEDIEEMNKCLALSRYTASVFHSLLVVEHGLIALGKHIGVTDPKAGWDATYKRLTELLKDRKSIPADIDFNFLEPIKAPLESMKLAWRNKVNHAAGRLAIEKTGFSDVSAKGVISACREFMRHLAEGLP